MITKIGITSLFAGLFVGIFAGISNFMGTNNFWVGLTLSKILGEAKIESIITWFDTIVIQDSLDFLFYVVPLFGLLLSIGAVFLVISMFVKGK